MTRRYLVIAFAIIAAVGCQRPVAKGPLPGPSGVVSSPPSLPAPSLPEAGGSSDVGSGSDNPLPEDGSAWFLGKGRKVRYCVEVAPDFGYKGDVREPLEKAFALWRAYLDRKGVELSLPEVYHFATTPEDRTADHRGPGRHCPTPAELETSNVDLVVYFGVRPPELLPYFRPYSRPTAFSRRLFYDRERHWGKGFLWLEKDGAIDNRDPVFHHVPKWHFADPLEVILAHELGHTLGVSHASGTIMDRNISHLLSDDYAIWQPPSIDKRRELVFGDLGREEYRAPVLFYYASGTSRAFQQITGFEPVYESRIKILRDSPYHWDRLTFASGERRFMTLLENGRREGFDSGDQSLFKIAMGPDLESVVQYRTLSYALNLRGNAVDGSAIQLKLEYNVSHHVSNVPDAPIVLYYVDGENPIPLATFCEYAMPNFDPCR